jgi:hypothetical protein
MVEFPLGILVMVGLATIVCVLAMYHVLACVLNHETTLHNLRNHVERLQNDYTLHCARMNGEVAEEFEVQIIDPETDILEVDEAEPANEVAEIAESIPAPITEESANETPSQAA